MSEGWFRPQTKLSVLFTLTYSGPLGVMSVAAEQGRNKGMDVVCYMADDQRSFIINLHPLGRGAAALVNLML